MWLAVGMDKNVNYQIYDNEEEYRRAIQGW
jgi:hypothetical protein